MDGYVDQWYGGRTGFDLEHEFQFPFDDGMTNFATLVTVVWIVLLALALLFWVGKKVWEWMYFFIRMLGMAVAVAAAIWLVLDV